LLPREKIQQYYEDIAVKHGLNKVVNFNTEIIKADWDDQQLLWILETKNTQTGVKKVWSANYLISAAGQFSIPRKADITGLDDFKGQEWHTVSWPKDASLKGKRVGVIGTGPSAAQLLPKIYKDVGSLVVYQRSPSHCLPRDDYVASPLRKWIFAHVPFALKLHKLWLLKLGEFLGRHAFVPGDWFQKKAIELAHRHLANQVKDPEIQNKLRSHDAFGCKRPLLLDDYYPLFNEPNVELVTDRVTGLTEHGILSKNVKTGQIDERDVDVLIWGTGYKPNEFGTCYPTKGRKGELLGDKYQPENFSLYGVAIDDFPNYATFLGPNSLTFEASVIELMEVQANFHRQIVEYLLTKNKGSFRYALVPRGERVKSWTLSLREGQAKHPAASPTCNSYYKAKSGIVYFWPYQNAKYKKLVEKPDFKDWYLLTNRAGQGETKISDVD